MVLARWSAPAFVAAYVLVSFSATPNPMMALWRPLLVGIGVAVALQLVLTLILRNRDLAGLAASAVVLLLVAAWVPLAVLAAAVLWLAAIQWRRRSRGEPLLSLSTKVLARNFGIFAFAFAAVSAFPVVGWAIRSAAAIPDDAMVAPEPNRPDIVVLLLDGYPRSDSLMDQFGFDNAPFEAELSERDFHVSPQSRSNYTATWATLASMFHGRVVDEIPGLSPAPTDPAEQYRRVMLALAESPVLQALRRDGYEIVTVPSPFESAALSEADRILAPPQLTSFELSLLQHSLMGHVVFSLAPEIVFDQHRARLESTLRLLADEVARESATPRFVFAHLLAPHAPVVYRADGSAAEPVSCFPDCSIYGFASAADWAGFPEQVEHVNRATLAIVDEIISANDDAIVILMSDHGSQRTGSESVYALRSFFAARLPADHARYADDVTPVSVISRLTSVASTPGNTEYRAWLSAPLAPLTMSPYTGQEP